MRIVWSETAIANLISIRKYIEQDKPVAARRLARRILLGQAPSGARTRASVERLAEHPHVGRPGREPETRELIVAGTPYIIAYRVYRGRLSILAVLHAALSRPEE